jgi:hypothetical protein
MQYMLLIYEDEAAEEKLPEEERSQSIGGHIALARRLREEGRLVGGDPLQPSSTATCVRVEAGRAMITDGPYAETKEQLAGFYIVEARDLDQALADAAAIPSAARGVVEVRPVLDLGLS